jgi:hypothetical protein
MTLFDMPNRSHHHSLNWEWFGSGFFSGLPPQYSAALPNATGIFNTSLPTGGSFEIASVSSVPEPSTLTLLGLGSLSLLGYGWRRRKQAA